MNNDATPWVHRDRYLAIFQTSSIRGLETLGVMTESYGSLLIPILLKKIPEDIRCLIFRADPLADSSLDRLRVAIRQKIETREKSHISSQEDSTSVEMDGEVFVPTAGTLLANAQQKQRIFNRKPKVTRPCTYCAETHRPERCDKITSVEERRSILQRQQRCLNCLGLKHTKSQCYSKGRCMKCKRKHHTSICEEKQENPNQSSSYQMKENSNSNSSQPPTHTTAKNTTHMGATHSLHPTNHILMQSAVTKIRGAGKQYRQARILFDTGSQRTFITQDMTHKLELKPTGKELLDVTTFGSFQSTRKTYDIVSFSISTETENITIKALVTPIICPPLSVMEKLKIPPALKGLKLADRLQSPENLDFDIIIGNDYYGQLITGIINNPGHF